MTNPETATVDRIPIAHSIVYAVRGMPEVADEYNAERTIAPHEISLTYRAAPDERLGRVHAYVKGWWMQDGRRVPMDKPVGRHFWGGKFEDWPVWLAEEARLHDPEAAVSVPPPAPRADDQAAAFREAAEGLLRLRDSLITEPDVTGKYLAGIERSAAELRRMAADAAVSGPCVAGEQQNETPEATPCDVPNGCEDGELCATHEEEQAHAEGEHEYCGVTCEVAMPTELMRNSLIAWAPPGGKGILAELERRAAAGLPPAVVAQPGKET